MYTDSWKCIKQMMRIIMLAFVANAAWGQTALQSDSTAAWLGIECEFKGLDVFIDGTCIGTTPLSATLCPSGSHIIRVEHPQPSSWLDEDWKTEIALQPGETKWLDVHFQRRVWISSDPPGAAVFLGETRLGETPLSVVLQAQEQSTVSLMKEGYEPLQKTLSTLTPSVLHMDLRNQISDWIAGQDTRRFKKTWIVAAGVVALLAGATGAYLKHRADRAYENYSNVGHPDTMERYFDSAKRLDTLSGVFYGLGEVILGISLFYVIKGYSGP